MKLPKEIKGFLKVRVNNALWDWEDFTEITQDFSSTELREILLGNSFDKSTRKGLKFSIAMKAVKEIIPVIVIMGVASEVIKLLNLNEVQNGK